MVATKVDPLAPFGPAVRAWFEATFEAPTPAQSEGWAAIAQGHHTLIHAPTGSGKTLAAFLWCLDRLVEHPSPAPTKEQPGTVRVLYVSPLKALTYDVERNLRAPLAGIALEAARLGDAPPSIHVASRTGDTPADERRDLVRHPPDILVTTPESLYLLLTSQAREILRGVEHVIVDEVHAIAGTKRGAHLALSLERLEILQGPDAAPIQRIGLSATQRPLETIARYLGGTGEGREVSIVDAGARKPLELQVVVPVEDMARLGEVLPMDEQPGGPVLGGELRTSIWPAIHPRILQLIREHRSTIVFTNSRRLAERLAQRLNELAGEELVRAHHGSIAREQRLEIEEELKAGRLPALVATSSLELGIDMGAVDLVIQVESPTSVARGLQRIGRAGHQVGEPSKGVIFPKYRGDLLETAVVVKGMHDGAIEQTTLPRNPLDVLAQQLVAMTIGERFTVDELLAIVRRAAPFETLTREALEGVLGMLSGAYPSDEFAELKPRVIWDRQTDTIDGRRDARVVAVTSGGTIPDRGLFPVFLEGEPGTTGRRVGELDEEMVYELRAGMHGDVVVLGASSWRIAEISPNRVTVTPAPGVPGKLPFWKGDSVGRPIELGRAMGAFVRETEDELAAGPKGRAKAAARLRKDHDLDALAAENLLAYLEDEREATGVLPTDRRIVVERFRDELGDWRLVVLTPFGGRVHAPWTMALEARLQERLGLEVQTIWSDDGIAIRLPEGEGSLDGVEALLFPEPEEIEDLVVGRVGQSSLFASRFRENAARALLLPRRRPGTRTPLWQQRQRAADLLAVASRYGSFPILVETYRECLADVFDLNALREILDGVRRREIAVHSVETARAVGLRELAAVRLHRRVHVRRRCAAGGAPGAGPHAGPRPAAGAARPGGAARAARFGRARGPRAEPPGPRRRAARPRPGPGPRPAAAARRPRDRRGGGSDQRRASRGLVPPRRARGVASRGPGEDRRRGALDRDGGRRAVPGRGRGLGAARRPAGVPRAGGRGARGAAGPLCPDARAVPRRRPRAPLGAPGRGGRGRAPAPGRRGLPAQRRVPARRRRARVLRPRGAAAAATAVAGQAAQGGRAGRPDHAGAVPAGLAGRRVVAVGRLLGIVDGGPGRGSVGLERLAEVVDQLAGLPIPASVLERDVLPARVPGYQPRLLDELGAMGEVAWVGRGSLGRDDGRVVLYRPGRELLRPTGPPDGVERPADEIHERVRAHLRRRGASFYRELFTASGGRADREVLDALWDLVWAGEVTNDTFAPLRALRWKRPAKDHRPRAGRLTALGPPEAAGRWSLVGDATDDLPDEAPAVTRTERAHALALALLERHGVVTREAVGERADRRRVLAPSIPVLRAHGGGRQDPPRLLRRRPGRGPVRAPGRGGSAAGDARPAGRAGGRPGSDRAAPGGGRPGEPVRRRPRVAASRRHRSAPVPARRRRVRGAGRRRGGRLRGPRRDVDPDAAGLRRSGGARGGPRVPPRPRRRRPGPRAGHREGRRRAGRRVAGPRGAARGGLRRRLSRVCAARDARPVGALRPCPRATRSPAPPRDCVRTWSAARSRGLGRGRRDRRSSGWSGRRSRPSTRWARTC